MTKNSKTNFQSIEEYEQYIETINIDDLKSILNNIDRDKYPERYNVAHLRLNQLLERDKLSDKTENTIVYGGFWRRLIANLIDSIIIIIPFFVFIFPYRNSVLANVYMKCAISILGLIYTIYFNLKYGGTVGKILTGLRIYTINFDRITIKEVLKRQSVDLVLVVLSVFASIYFVNHLSKEELSSYFHNKQDLTKIKSNFFLLVLRVLTQVWFWGELLTLLFNDKKRAIHDFLAGTVVANKATVKNEIY